MTETHENTNIHTPNVSNKIDNQVCSYVVCLPTSHAVTFKTHGIIQIAEASCKITSLDVLK